MLVVGIRRRRGTKCAGLLETARHRGADLARRETAIVLLFVAAIFYGVDRDSSPAPAMRPSMSMH